MTVNLPVSNDMIEHFRHICKMNKKIKILSEKALKNNTTICHCEFLGPNTWEGVPDSFVMGYEIGVYMGIHNDEGLPENVRKWEQIDGGKYDTLKVPKK